MNRNFLISVCMVFGLLIYASASLAVEIYVESSGKTDAEALGTRDKPFTSLDRAQQAVRKYAGQESVTVYLRQGVYWLGAPLTFDRRDSGTAEAPVVWRAYPGEKPIISGGKKLELVWNKTSSGRFDAEAPRGMVIDQLFVDGERMDLARWPNKKLDERGVDIGYARGLKPVEGEPVSKVTPPLRGYPAFTFDPEQFTDKKWASPHRAVIHVFQNKYWGNMQWRLRGVDYENHRINLGEGGWQVGTLWWEKRANSVAPNSKFYIENVLEELDELGEWYHDGSRLYLLPPHHVDNLNEAEIVVSNIKQLILFQGTQDKPVRHVHLKGITFKHTARTIMDEYEDRLRGDWAITRQAAVKLTGTEDCTIHDCTFTALGGNAVFISNYNRRATVSDCLFHDLGDSAVAIVGSDEAVRSLEVHEKYHVPLTEIDTKIGPKTPNYPAECTITNNLMYDLGVFGKQVAGVYLSACERIHISHNTIFRIPRAGICINDGCWGGHIIEYNDVSMTVRETSDHGPFNSWGRDRFWQSLHRDGRECDMTLSKKYALLDNYLPTVIRNNRFAHPTNDPRQWIAGSDYEAPGSFSWGIDLDDGASNYHVYNNLCLGMSIKLREGYYRTVENNIFIGPYPPNKHECFEGSNDIYTRNIYVNTKDGFAWSRGPATKDLPTLMDYNLYFNHSDAEPIFGVDRSLAKSRRLSLEQWREMGMDKNSVFADPMFVDPAGGDYRVEDDSPAIKLGFKNFPMDRFGTQKKEFQPIIREEIGVE